MSIVHLEEMFCPRSLAVVGASETPGSVGEAVCRNLMDGGFTGKIHLVNPRRKKLWGHPCHASLEDLQTPVDLAVMAAPIQSAPAVVAACVRQEVKGLVIISAGGKEVGEKGRLVENAIRQAARGSGLRIIGPNCIGIICSTSRLNASFASHLPLPGKMAFVSQSGAICTAVLDLSMAENIGFSHFVSLGSMLDVDFGDMIDFLGGDPEVSSIVMYVEGLTNFRKFMSAARAVSRVKPVIALKAGRSAAGARAAASHTGSMAGEDAVYDAAFKRAGILRVKTFEELFDCAELVSKQPTPRGSGLAIVTNAGGPGVMAADAISDYGCAPVELRPGTLRQLDQILPPHWSRGNPVDILGDASPKVFRQAVEICLEAEEINGLLVMFVPQALTAAVAAAEQISSALKDRSFPVFTAWMGGPGVQKARDVFNRAGIPTFDSPERAVRAFMDLHRYARNIEMLQQTPPGLPRKLTFNRTAAAAMIRQHLADGIPWLDEVDAKRLLAAYGIPVNPVETAATADEAVRKARSIGFPVALKIHSPDITHKSDVDGVHLHLVDDDGVQTAFQRAVAAAKKHCPAARLLGVTVQPMMLPSGQEIILGAKKDGDFGPVLLFGTGGMMAEIFGDRAIALPPLNRLLARRMMQETRIYSVLKGFRGLPPANLSLLEEILIRLSQLVTDFAEIAELDINPLRVAKGLACAVDARVLLAPAEKPAPLHLVISPYPNQYERPLTTSQGQKLLIRPIRPEDAPLLEEMFDTLSPRSIYFRFFSPLKRLPHSMLARFTQIDYDRQIALVCIDTSPGVDRMIGVARVIAERDPRCGEFAVLVSDPWQGMGIGAALLRDCLKIAKTEGIERVRGFVLAENTQMLALGRKLGLRIEPRREIGEYEMAIDLRNLGSLDG